MRKGERFESSGSGRVESLAAYSLCWLAGWLVVSLLCGRKVFYWKAGKFLVSLVVSCLNVLEYRV